MNPGVAGLVQARRERIEGALGDALPEPQPSQNEPISQRERDYLLDEARDLYLNEVEWERITEEEQLEDGPLAELTFPGFLAFVRGLLLRDAMPDSLAPANPRPEVVEDIAAFLAGRVIELRAGDDDGDGVEWELSMAERLIDLVLFALHGLSKEDVARIESRAGD